MKSKVKKVCIVCGKELLTYQNKFCSSSCSVSYNNKLRKLTDCTKGKISESLLNHYGTSTEGRKRYENGRLEHMPIHKCVCQNCGVEFFSKKKTQKYCSKPCQYAALRKN